VRTLNKQLRYKVNFDSDIEKINPLFSRVKIRIAYTGENRNGSFISKETFEKALPTIYNCPIIGEFIETVDDFGSHGGKIEISDQGIKYIQTTKPYGVINENSEITWEDVFEEDGTINTYLCATGYLWTGRYDELFSVIQNSKSQSMEIEVSNGEVKNIGGKQIYNINEFIFSAFCILGDSVEPCFESASVTSYNFNKDEFKKQFNEMLDELKQFSKDQSPIPRIDNINNSEKEDKILNEKLELLKKYNLTVESLSFSIEEISLEELENKIKTEYENKDDNETKIVTEFSSTYRQKREALQNALDPKTEKDSDGNLIYEEYLWIEDFDDVYAFVEKSIWTPDNYERKYGRFSYTFNEETITATISGEFEEMVLTWLTLEENQKLQEERNNYSKLQGDFDEYKNKYSTSNEEVERLKKFEKDTLDTERKEAEESLFEQFAELNGMEEFEELKKNSASYELDTLEKECFALLGKKNAKFQINKSSKKDKVKIEFSKKEDEVENEYDDLFEQYLHKNN
jgi:hypothetical protein